VSGGDVRHDFGNGNPEESNLNLAFAC